MGWDQEVKDRQVLNACVSEDQRWGQWRRGEKSAQESIHQGASGEGTWELSGSSVCLLNSSLPTPA